MKRSEVVLYAFFFALIEVICIMILYMNTISVENKQIRESHEEARHHRPKKPTVFIQRHRIRKRGINTYVKYNKTSSRKEIANENRTTETPPSPTTKAKLKNSSSLTPSQDCRFYFADKKELSNAKSKISKFIENGDNFYLLYIHLKTLQNMQNLSDKDKNAIFEWQFVKKNEKFLVQMPVDFNLLTFDILRIDKEETDITLNIMRNGTECRREDAISDMRQLLWSELLDNDTKFYLCNRDFQSETGRELLYIITTIWIGYDLTCYPSYYGEDYEPIKLDKEKLPLITPVLCFFLALQFVWICSVIEMRYSSVEDIEGDANHSENNGENAESSVFAYHKEDRPYGLSRIVRKVFFYKFQCCHSERICRPVYENPQQPNKDNCCCPLINLPSFRLMWLLYIFVLVPFGFYRTVYRYKISERNYHEYGDVVRPSEPLCRLAQDENSCDMWYMFLGSTVGALVFVIVYEYNLKIFLKVTAFYLEVKHENHRRIIDRFSERVDLLIHLCGRVLKIFKSCCCCNDDCKSERCLCSHIYLFCAWPFEILIQLILCIFPIIPFVFQPFFCCDCSICCAGSCCYNDADEVRCCDSYYFSKFCTKSYNCCKKCPDSCKERCSRCKDCYNFCNKPTPSCILSFFMNVFIVFITIVTFRPMISTFTFLLRSLTYFFFVALPMRAHLYRYFFMVATAFAYFAKYYSEIVNVFQDILKHIFEKDEKTKQIGEDVYDRVISKLMFVKTKLYFFVMKCVIVTCYLFITIETFLNSGQSNAMTNFKEYVEFALLIIGPYAISVFLKVGKESYLHSYQKSEINRIYEEEKKKECDDSEFDKLMTCEDCRYDSLCHPCEVLLSHLAPL